MRLDDINLWEKAPDSELFQTIGDPNNEGLPTITPYLLDGDDIRPAILVAPGGVFRYRAEHEGEPIALWLNRLGFHAFVINYRVAPFTPYTSMKDAIRAIRYVRYYAKKFHVDPEQIGMIGSSAGGYLTAFIGTHLDNEERKDDTPDKRLDSIILGDPNPTDPIDQVSTQLHALVLCYAEITPFSNDNLPPEAWIPKTVTTEELIDYTSCNKHVTSKTPPTFMWVTSRDGWHFQKKDMLFAQALSELDVEYDLHIFAKGPHGLGLAESEPTVSMWTTLCENWLKDHFTNN